MGGREGVELTSLDLDPQDWSSLRHSRLDSEGKDFSKGRIRRDLLIEDRRERLSKIDGEGEKRTRLLSWASPAMDATSAPWKPASLLSAQRSSSRE